MMMSFRPTTLKRLHETPVSRGGERGDQADSKIRRKTVPGFLKGTTTIKHDFETLLVTQCYSLILAKS